MSKFKPSDFTDGEQSQKEKVEDAQVTLPVAAINKLLSEVDYLIKHCSQYEHFILSSRPSMHRAPRTDWPTVKAEFEAAMKESK